MGLICLQKEELLAFTKTNDEICEFIKAKSLKFLSLNGLYRALKGEERNPVYPQFMIIILLVSIQ